MALIVQGGLAATVSGKVGNSVFARNRGGAYIRNYVKPVNPQSALQAAIRSTFAATVSAWQTLGANNQSAFAAVAAATPLPNRVGLTSILPPLSMFQKINVGRAAAGLPLVTTAPNLPLTDDWNPGAFAVEITSNNSLTVHYDGTSDWVTGGTTDDALLVYLSPPQSPSKNFYKGKFNFAVGLRGGAPGASTGNLIMGYPGGFTASGGGSSGAIDLSLVSGPNFQPGMKYFARGYVTRDDGHIGPDGTSVSLAP